VQQRGYSQPVQQMQPELREQQQSAQTGWQQQPLSGM
jgi:hypothetical protein